MVSWKPSFVIICVVLWSIPIEKRKYGLSQSNLVTDYTGLLPKRVERVVKAENRTELQKIVVEANEKVSKFPLLDYSTHKAVYLLQKMVSFLICGHSMMC